MTARLLALSRAIERLSARDMQTLTAALYEGRHAGSPCRLDGSKRFFITQSMLEFSQMTISQASKVDHGR